MGRGHDQARQRPSWWGVLALILAEPGAPCRHWAARGWWEWLGARVKSRQRAAGAQATSATRGQPVPLSCSKVPELRGEDRGEIAHRSP